MAESVCVDPLPFPHGFFTRRGGVSTGPFASLNCSLSSPDDRDAVLENRGLVADALGIGRHLLLGCTQVHGTEVAHVEAPWQPGAGPRADAMVTDRPGLALGIVTADCAPVLFADAEAGVIGAAHAGWKGALGGVTDSAIAAMEALGARRERIAAAIGPCISQANYETGPEFRERFPEEFFQGRYFDLEAYVAERLAAADIQNVARLRACTYAREADFFSFRRTTHRGEADYGRQVSAIVLAN
jgi:polyphenol oxidase